MRGLAYLSWLASIFVAVGGGMTPLDAAAAQSVTLTHVHGLAFTATGNRLLVPSHRGLAVYGDGHWSKAPGPEHDYMGFSVTNSYLFSSGHPAPGSNLVNPFGLIRSADGGGTWDRLGMEGESDFHLMAAGYGTNAVCVYNAGRNSRMDGPGLYCTLNQGFSWNRAEAKGLQGDILSLALHPARSDTLAVGTKTALYLSRDGGRSFRALARGAQVLAVSFDLDGEHLWYGAYAGAPSLMRIDLQGKHGESLALPRLGEDAVAYIAQNPAQRKELAIATFRRNIYLSGDSGKTWRTIAREGQGL
jgi:photosystem II stability/assembly factor-like uncharacterized protein